MSLTVAVKSCPLPKNLAHGSSIISSLNTSTNSIPHGASIYYQCNIGYQLEDGTSSLSKCHYGDWSGAEPKCVEHPPQGSCPEPPAIHSGYYYYTGADSTNRKNAWEGSKIQYMCTSDRYACPLLQLYQPTRTLRSSSLSFDSMQCTSPPLR